MTGADFYYQQCPSAEETTNSYPEPPDVELPLFVQQSSAAPSFVDEPINSETSDHVSKKRKRDKDDDDLSDQMRNAMKHLKNITALLTNNEDEFELFGKSVALQLKKMSLCTALGVQAKIQQILSEYRINDIKKTAEKKSTTQNEEKKDIEENNSSEENDADKTDEDKEQEEHASPPLSLTCASETSDNENNEEECEIVVHSQDICDQN